MATSLAVLALLALLLGVFYILYGLKINYDDACKTGLPIIVLPFDSANPLWMIIDRKVTQQQLVRRIPFCSGNFTRFNWRGWEIRDRYRAHQQLGDALLFVTPGKNLPSAVRCRGSCRDISAAFRLPSAAGGDRLGWHLFLSNCMTDTR